MIMKKSILIVLCLLLLMVTACADVTVADDDIESHTVHLDAEIAEYVDSEEDNNNQEAEAEVNQFTKEQYLQDLDYMLEVLENNFALFDVAYWAKGVDIYTIIENIRQEIIDTETMDVDSFYKILGLNFLPLNNIGHFYFMTPDAHYYTVIEPSYLNLSQYDEAARGRFKLEHVVDFYEPRYKGGEMEANENDQAEFLSRYPISKIEEISYYFTLYGEYELAERFLEAYQKGNYLEAAEILDYGDDILQNIPIVTTKIIEDEKIAYLSINSFIGPEINRPRSPERRLITQFLKDIHDYEHLIIDLRVNNGGNAGAFYDSVMKPLLSKRFTLEGFVFFNSRGTFVNEIMINPTHNSWDAAGFKFNYNEARLTEDILKDFELTEFNYDDAIRVNYGFPVTTELIPSRVATFGSSPSFDGKIWVLTSNLMGSAAQIVPWAIKETGFATLVGERTGGCMGGPRTVVDLPNSGILFQIDLFSTTDRNGFPLEAGTEPDYYNRDGMDALQTTLLLIEEGNY
jgi:uncharacterized protein YxeA